MCKAFSCLVLKSGEVKWKFGVDSHTDLLKLAGLKDDTSDSRLLKFARVEISPANNSYLQPDKWEFHLDQSITPEWWTECDRQAAMVAYKKWLVRFDKILVHKKVVNPFLLPAPKITSKEIQLLRNWASVWDSVWDSVGDSVGAYAGSFFRFPRKAWKHTERIKGSDYPFQSAVTLWNKGLVPSFDGKLWRLHGGKGGGILWKGTV